MAETYGEKLVRMDGWLFELMANQRVRITIEGEVSRSDLSVCASLYEHDGVDYNHVCDGYGETPLAAMEDLVESAANADARK